MRIILIIIFMFLAQSCSLLDSGIEWRDGNYVVLWIDSQENVSLSYKASDNGYISIIPPKIVAVGKDEQFIVIQQKPLPNSSDVVYFVIKKAKDLSNVDTKENVIGPLSVVEFRKMKLSQKLPDFSKRVGAKDEKWRLLFVIPIALIMIIIFPFFFAAWVATAILIFRDFPTNIFYYPKVKDLKLFFNLKEIIKSLKQEGWSLILVRTLGMSVAVHGFVIMMALAGAVFLVERILSLPF